MVVVVGSVVCCSKGASKGRYRRLKSGSWNALIKNTNLIKDLAITPFSFHVAMSLDWLKSLANEGINKGTGTAESKSCN